MDGGIPIAQPDSLVLIRSGYALAVGVGTWLAWALAGMAAVGVLIVKLARLPAMSPESGEAAPAGSGDDHAEPHSHV